MNWTKETLQAFERGVASDFNDALIKAPVHLEGGNEEELLDIFSHVRSTDWVLCSWRSHCKCLLKGVPPELLKKHILEGYSIALNYPEYRIFSSAIVGGILPIAVGIAWAIKRAGLDERVWVFCGDMTARTGMYHECSEYAYGHGLPVEFVIEDNGLSVCTKTAEAWGSELPLYRLKYSRYYHYHLQFPHSGAGKRVEF